MAKKQSRFLRPGKGVSRNERKKNVVFRFFELFIRKITPLCFFNIMYLICILPLICAIVVCAVAAFGISPETVSQTVFVNLIMRISLKIPPVLAYILLAVSALVYGPVTCGFSYAMRNLSTENHVWYSELFTRAKDNFKQGLVIGIVDILVFVCFFLYITMNMDAVGEGMQHVYSIMRFIAVIAAIFYLFMRNYLYTLAVSFYLPIKGLFKNAYIFAVLGFFRNVLVAVICIVAVFAFTATPYLDIFLTVTILLSLCGFLTSYATYPVIKKYMIDAQEKPSSEEPEEEIEE